MATFRACASAIGVFQPDWFVLENVDMDSDDAESNLAIIVKYLTDLGYEVQVFRTCASDFGLPQAAGPLVYWWLPSFEAAWVQFSACGTYAECHEAPIRAARLLDLCFPFLAAAIPSSDSLFMIHDS